MKTKITLINANLVQIPAVAPVALDVLNTSLRLKGYEVDLLDLTLVAGTYQKAIKDYFSINQPDFVGISFRNAWDMVFNSVGAVPYDGSFVPAHIHVAKEVLKYFPRDKIIAGGVGFSSIPEYMLEKTGLRFGVIGAGDSVFAKIIESLERGIVPRGLKGFIEKGFPYLKADKEEIIPVVIDRKNFVDNKWYFRHGGLAGLRTSNGCRMQCAYCMEPSVKGGIFLRNPDLVVAELDQLVEQGITDVHIIDSEANMPLNHSKAVKRAIIVRGYPKELRLWEYAQVLPFDEEYATLAKAAGVAGISFSADHVDPEILKSFNKWYALKDIIKTTKICKDNGILVMHELLFGMPGDDLDKIKKAIDAMRSLDPYLTAITVGIGITPGCPLSRNPEILSLSNLSKEEQVGKGLYCSGKIFCDPTYFVSPTLKIPEVYDFIKEYIGEDFYRFMIPTQCSISKTDNQLVNSERVQNLIQEGKTGAYWAHYREPFKKK